MHLSKKDQLLGQKATRAQILVFFAVFVLWLGRTVIDGPFPVGEYRRVRPIVAKKKKILTKMKCT